MSEIIFDGNGEQVPVIQPGESNPDLAKFLEKAKPKKAIGRESKLTDKLKQDLLEARKLGYNNVAIADLFGIGISTVSLYLKRMKSEGYDVTVQEKRQKKSSKIKYNDDAKAKLVELYNNGCSVREIAKAMGVSEQTIYNYQFYMRSEGYLFGEDSVTLPSGKSDAPTTDIVLSDINTNPFRTSVIPDPPARIKKTSSTVSKEELVFTLGGFTVKISK